MKRLIFAMLITVLIFSLCGCADIETSPHACVMSGDRFVITSERTTDNTCYVEFYDKNTNVQYVFMKLGSGGSISVLYDENGKPLLYDHPTEKGGAE